LAMTALLAGVGTAQPLDSVKLRQAVELPDMNIPYQKVSLEDLAVGAKPGKATGGPCDIAALKESMKGDVTDAERYLRLGDLYDEANDEKHAKEACAKALDLVRTQFQDHPDNGLLLMQEGLALSGLDKDVEAEAALRRAVEKAPHEWKCWVKLGDQPWHKVSDLFFLPKTKFEGITQLAEKLETADLSADKIAAARKLLEEMKAIFDKAVAAGPTEPEPYEKRAWFYWNRGFWLGAFAIAEGMVAEVERVACGPEFAADLQRAAELGPRDLKAVNNAAICIVNLISAVDKDQLKAAKTPLTLLSEQSRKSVLKLLSIQDDLAQSKDPAVAVPASVMAAFYYGGLRYDTSYSEKHLRRAILLDPTCKMAWDLLIAVLSDAKRYDDLVACLEKLVERDDTVLNRLQLASACDRASKPNDVETQVQAALKLDPKHFNANLFMAAVLLRRGDNEALVTAKERLEAARDSLDCVGEAPRLDYFALRGIHFALCGDLEQARIYLKAAVLADENHLIAKPALEILD